jgi:predicted HTH transcriptional regulator
LTDDEFAMLLDSGAEQRNVEFKSPGPISDKQLLYKVTRAVLGMTNHLDGGLVIVGVSEHAGKLVAKGVAEADVLEWTRDTLADKVAPLVDPSVDFDVEHRVYDGRAFVLIAVREFDETPVFCRSNKHDQSGNYLVLREGALYVRGRRKPETVEVRTSQEMRDLLDLALRKRLRHFTELLQAAGGPYNALRGPSDTEKFQMQIADVD